jgi:hypothetical protein
MATNKVTNSFVKGISRDLSISKNNNQSITYGLDINIMTNEGESTGSITNHKGNALSFTLPNTFPIYVVELDGNTGSPQMTINGIGPLVFSITSESTILDIYNEITASYAAYITAGQYGIYYNNQQVVIVGFTLDPNVLIGPPNTGLSVATLVPTQRDLSVIGWTTLEDDIILFTTDKNNTNADPITAGLSYYGQVWRVRYDRATDTIISPNGADLNSQDHLIYNGLLQFSLANEIEREAIGVIENTIKGTVYWTDNYNNPRALNILNPQSFAIPVSLLDWKPDVQQSTPIIEDILQGGTLPVGAYQIAYQLYTNDGAVSNYSPTSTVITVTDSTENEAYQNYDGGELGVDSGKSIKFRVGNIDRDYDYIKFVYVRYTLQNQPEIFSFLELPIAADSMEGVLTGNEETTIITLSEFVNPLISFDTCKTFTQKKNRLYPANTTSRKFDIEYDARAYRFNSGRICRLYKQNGTNDTFDATIPANITALYALDEDHDAVNAYNDESGSIFGLVAANYGTWTTTYQYKFQEDGTTFGGEGPNIKYEFTTYQTIGDETLNGAQQFVPFVRVNTTVSTTDSLLNPNVTDLEHPVEGVNSSKNELVNTIYVGYCRGEIYRFGIVFLNDKGEESFTKWIGDIRIPEPWENSAFNLTQTTGNTIEMNQLGIKFTIKDVTDLPDDITGFRIVRMERTIEHKTRLGSGLLLGAIKTLIDYDGPDPLPPVSAYTIGYLRTGAAINAFGTPIPANKRLHIYHNTDMFNDNLDPVTPIVDNPAGNDVAIKQELLGSIKFPEFDFEKYTVGDASYVRVMNEYDITDNTRYWDLNTSGTFNSVAEFYKLETEYSPAAAIALNRTLINAQTGVGIDGVVTSSFSATMGGFDFLNINVYDCEGPFGGTSDCTLSGFGTKMLFCEFNSNPTNATNNDITLYGNNRARVVSLFKHNIGQYNGPWRYSRYGNRYIACSDFIPINLITTSGTLEIDVFGGDIFVNYYSTTVTFMHWKEHYGIDNASPSGLGSIYKNAAASMSASAFCFPVETTINTEMRMGEYWNKSQVFSSFNSTTFAKFLSDDYEYNDIYSQQNNIKNYFSLPFNFEELTNQANYVWVSNKKVNDENIDNWRIYNINNPLPLELVLGEINRIVNVKENVIAVQEKGMAAISTEERSAIEDTTGAVMALGTGTILNRYDYISKETGSLHQHSVVTTPNALYHFDARLGKMFVMKPGETGLMPLSDVRGLFEFFKSSVVGNIKDSDQILLGKGIHGVYDSKYGKTYYTFLNKVRLDIGTITVLEGNRYRLTGYNPNYLYDIFSIGNTYNIGAITITIDYIDRNVIDITLISGSINSIEAVDMDIRYTIAYNENLQGFESFYSFTPTLYISTGERLLSCNPLDTNKTVYEHYKGNYGVFYNQTPTVSQVEFIVNLPDQSKIPTFRLNNLDVWTECFDSNLLDVPLETITGCLVYSDYQTSYTSLLDLIPQTDIVRKERTWRINKLFDYTDPNAYVKPYFRNKYSKIRLMYDNINNNNFKLHEVTSNITLSYY